MARNDRPFPPEILYLAKRYLWWQSLEETLRRPLRLVAAIMEEGTRAECAQARTFFGPAIMRQALRRAEPGWFHARRWEFWHRELQLIPSGAPAPTPPARAPSGSRGGRPPRQATAAERRALSTSSITT